jgi:hypothetical protein
VPSSGQYGSGTPPELRAPYFYEDGRTGPKFHGKMKQNDGKKDSYLRFDNIDLLFSSTLFSGYLNKLIIHILYHVEKYRHRF